MNEKEKATLPCGPAEDDRILRFFRSPFFLSITIGVPFCIYKFIFGSLAIRGGTGGEFGFVVLGSLVIIWASLDLIMNIARAGLDLSGKSNVIEYCTIAQVGRYFHAQGAFLALDTMLSFFIICITLWSGWIAKLTATESFFWYTATTLNLISLSLVIIYDEALMVRRTSRKNRLPNQETQK